MTSQPLSIQYDVDIFSVAGHLFNIKLTISAPTTSGQTLSLPAWIPGSYMIRDFAKHVVGLKAKSISGATLEVKKSDKQTWHIAPCNEAIIVDYQVYAYDLSVRGAYINEQYAFFNGSNLFLEVVDQSHLPCTMRLLRNSQSVEELNIATTMPLLHQGNKDNLGIYQADNYAELIDHPVLIGEFDTQLFSSGEVEFELVFAGGHQSDMQRISKDLSQLCQQHLILFGSPAPISRYLFITLLTDAAFGGLEHRASTALMFARNDLAHHNEPSIPSESYRTFLSLCSHEFFHTWHVKRIKPVELVQGTLQTESYTEQLWIYEGITSYYDDLLLQRSKIIPTEDYLEVLGQNLTRLQRNQGRFKQSVAESSFDAWTKFYKQDESAINNIVSYYNKGAIVALCLDLTIRLKSQMRYSLDDVMIYLWQHYGQRDIPTEKNVIHKIIKQHLQLDVKAFLDTAIHSTDDLPVASLLKKFGILLHTRSRIDGNDKGGKSALKTTQFDFGAQFKNKEFGVEITQVTEHSAAYHAGILVGDIIVALGEWQVSASNLFTLIDRMSEHQQIKLSVLRDKRFLQLTFTSRLAPLDTIYLSIENQQQVQHWLK